VFAIQAGLSTGANNGDVPRALIEQRSGISEAFTERFKRAQLEGDLAPSADPAALARYLHMVVLGLSIQAQDGMSENELKESAERALMGSPANQSDGSGAAPPSD
jgi:hypothetical protein